MNRPEDRDVLVSIGMPTRNRSRYIREALDSLVAQTYKNFELVISDNASSDDTQAVCEEYARKDRRIRYVRQTELVDVMSNWNAVRAQAKGAYFMWAADDDKWAHDFLERCIAVFRKNPELAMVASGFEEFDDRGRKMSYDPARYFPSERGLYERLRQFILFYNDDGKANLLYGLWNCDKVKGNALGKLYWGIDINFVFRSLASGPFGFVDATLFFKRMRPAHFDSPPKKNLIARIFRSVFFVRFPMIFSKLYFPRFVFIAGLEGLSFWQKLKLMCFNLFAACRLFFSRRI